jgi:hypothetical protein
VNYKYFQSQMMRHGGDGVEEHVSVKPKIDTRWESVEAALETPEWGRDTAIHLFLGLNPETTHFRSEGDFVHYGWLGDSLPDNAPNQPGGMADYDFDMNMQMAYERMCDIVSNAPPQIRRPSDWLEWGIKIGVEPPWLKAAYGRKELVKLLPLNMAARKDGPARPHTAREAGQIGGKTRAKQKYGKMKELLAPFIDQWAEGRKLEVGAKMKTKARLSQELHAILLDKFDNAVEPRTIVNWMKERVAERERQSLEAS